MPPSPPPSGDDRSSPSVSVVIPVLDERGNLPYVLEALPVVDEVVVVDGGAADRTLAAAGRIRPDAVLVRQTRSGRGNALACGFAASTGDIVVTVPADGSADPGDIPRFVRALLAGAEAAHGSRFREGGGDLAGHRLDRLADAMLSRLANALFDTRFTDLGASYHAFWRDVLPALGLPAPAGGDRPLRGDGPEIDLLLPIRTAARGLRVVEVGTVRYPRMPGDGRDHRWRRTLIALRTLLAEYLRHRRPARRPPAPARHADPIPRTVRPGLDHQVRVGPAPVRPPSPGPAPYVAGERSTGRHAAHSEPVRGRRTPPRSAASRSNRASAARWTAPQLPDPPRDSDTGRRRGYPGTAPWATPSPGAHRSRDVADYNTGVRRSGIYDTGVHHLDREPEGVHRAGEYDSGSRRSGLYDTGVHRLGVYDSGVHRTDVYDTGAHHLIDGEDDGSRYRPAVPREVGGGRRRLDARDRGSEGRPDLTVIPGEGLGPQHHPEDPPAGAPPGHLRALPGERSTR